MSPRDRTEQMAGTVVRRIQTQEELLSLRSQWNALLSRSYTNDITLTWEWVSSWWRVFGDRRRLSILTAWDSEELVGIAPFDAQIRSYPVQRSFPNAQAGDLRMIRPQKFRLATTMVADVMAKETLCPGC